MKPGDAEFIVRATRERYRCPWLVLREDDVTFPDGSTGIYSVVERGEFGVAVPELAPDRLVLVSVYRHPVGRRFWEFPQGSNDDPHLDAVAVTAAELREEAGYQAGRWQRLGRLHEAYGFATGHCQVFLARDLTEVGARPAAEEGRIDRGVFSVAEVWRLIEDGHITDAVTVAALGLYDRARRTELPR